MSVAVSENHIVLNGHNILYEGAGWVRIERHGAAHFKITFGAPERDFQAYFVVERGDVQSLAQHLPNLAGVRPVTIWEYFA